MEDILKKALGMRGFKYFLEYTILPILNAIANHENRLTLAEYMVLHNDFYTPISVEDEDESILVDDDGTVILADWKYNVM